MNVPIDISNTVLNTERLVLRPWKLSDLDDLYSYASVDGVGQMAGWKPHESRKESLSILNSFIDDKKTFALELNGKVIGSLGIETYDERRFPELSDKRCREIGFVLSKDCWGNGLMPEAIKETIRFLFEEAGLDVILCGHFSSNLQSKRVQEKCGFRHYSDITYRTRMNTVEDAVINILSKEDWAASVV